MSQVSGSRLSGTGARPLNVTLGAKGGMAGIPADPMADLQVPAWNDAVKELIEIREKLEKHSKKPKKKKKKKKKDGLLKRMNTDAVSEWDDGVTSAYTSQDNQDDMFAGLIVDYAFTNFQQGNKPREFKTDYCKATWMLDKLGISDYDKVSNLDKLVFTMADAIREARFTWKTISIDRIKYLTKQVITRELNMLDGRKDAQRYAATRMPTISDFEMDNVDAKSVTKSVAAVSQYSGSRASPSPYKKQMS